MILAHHITTPTTGHLCQSCGITISEGRSYRYDNTCRDCAPYLGITRKKAA